MAVNDIIAEGSGAEGGVSLSRDLRLFDITMIGVGAMIGAGIFVLTGAAAGTAGPALIAAFLLNGVVTTFTAMSYAELGSAYPEAGGGYLWVKEGLGGSQGFLSGWMSWFAHVVAGSLYGLGFGSFATELWHMAGLPDLGISEHVMTLIFMTVVIVLFTFINYLGASETGAIGNVITIAKVLILAFFVISGLAAMGNAPEWRDTFSEDFLPNGVGGVFIAMGLTFIAFEGYEIIAQSGEEVINPRRNVPRAIFFAIVAVVIIYVAVAFVSLGAIDLGNIDSEDLVKADGTPITTTYEYLGEQGEVAVVRAAEQFMPAGAVLLLISGLASTMSALNATTYSSSRVSFAMGRDHNLTEHFARIHPRRHTPYVAVLASGALMIVLAWGMQETETVASAADIMFLLLFLQVNVALMTLRHKMPEIDRGFIVPLFPWVPLIGIFSNLALTIFLFIFKPVAAVVIGVWIVAGLLTYFAYFSRKEALEKPTDILHEEVLVSRKYSVLVPVSSHEQARILGQIGAIIAADHDGEVLALHVAKVPPQLSLADGRYFRKEGRDYLETVIDQARTRDVPVHTMIRLSRKVPDAVGRTANENASNLIVLGWPGRTSSTSRMFGNVIDPIVDNPPTDIALVRYREDQRPIRSVLVAVAGGLNSRHAARLAISIARQSNKLQLGFAGADGDQPLEPLDEPIQVDLVHVLPAGATEALRVRGEKALAYAHNGTTYPHISKRIIGATNAFEALKREAVKHDLIIIGASEEPLFRNMLFGNLAEELAREAPVSVIVVKRRSGPIHRFLRQTVLEPTTGEPVVRNGRNNKNQQEVQKESEDHQAT